MSLVVEEGPGFRVERGERGDTLVVVGQWNREAQTIIESGLVDGLDLNYTKGFKDVDLQFVKAWPIRRLELLARTVTDLSPLHRLGERLESVSMQSAESSRLDLGQFPHLTRLAADWPQVRETVHVRTSLVEVYLGGYRENDLRPLGPLTALESLTMKDRPSVVTLAGAEEFTRLERLGLFGAPLGSLKGIEPLEQLRELQREQHPLHPLRRRHRRRNHPQPPLRAVPRSQPHSLLRIELLRPIRPTIRPSFDILTDRNRLGASGGHRHWTCDIRNRNMHSRLRWCLRDRRWCGRLLQYSHWWFASYRGCSHG